MYKLKIKYMLSSNRISHLHCRKGYLGPNQNWDYKWPGLVVTLTSPDPDQTWPGPVLTWTSPDLDQSWPGPALICTSPDLDQSWPGSVLNLTSPNLDQSCPGYVLTWTSPDRYETSSSLFICEIRSSIKFGKFCGICFSEES